MSNLARRIDGLIRVVLLSQQAGSRLGRYHLTVGVETCLNWRMGWTDLPCICGQTWRRDRWALAPDAEIGLDCPPCRAALARRLRWGRRVAAERQRAREEEERQAWWRPGTVWPAEPEWPIRRAIPSAEEQRSFHDPNCRLCAGAAYRNKLTHPITTRERIAAREYEERLAAQDARGPRGWGGSGGFADILRLHPAGPHR